MNFKIIFCLVILSSITQANYIVFEKIGHMATSVTYIHTQVTINTNDIEKMLNKYNSYLHSIFKKFAEIVEGERHNEDIQAIAKQAEEVIYTFMMDFNGLQEEFRIIKWLLPVDPKRTQRFLDVLGFGLGIMGTFFGIYNSAQIAQIKTGLANVKFTEGHIIRSLIEFNEEQKKIKAAVTMVDMIVQEWRLMDPGLLAARIARMEKIIQRAITQLTHTFQMAQAHRLAIDFMEADKLNALYAKISKKAEQKKLQLLTEKPLDLFQLEVTYFSNGTDLHIIIHVPAVASDSLLQLYKMHPLPLPINKNQVLVPHVRDNVLGLSKGSNKLAAHLSSTDLLDCKNIHNVFLCDRHAVLHKNINASCMGALYLQNFDSAAQLCPLQIKPIEEIVHQLADNWFLIFTPRPQTAAISCLNGTESQYYLPEGISKRHLSEGCRADFTNHVLFSDSSVTLDGTIQHFDWTWMKDLVTIDNLTAHLRQMHDFGFKDPTMKEINDFQAHGIEGVQYHWHLATIIISITLAAIFFFLFCFCCTNRVCLKKYLAFILFSKPSKDHIAPKVVYDARKSTVDLEDLTC